MNNKHLITWLVIVWVITAVWLFVSFVSNTDAKVELSDQEICNGTWSTFEQRVEACGRVIAITDENYIDYSWQLAFVHQKIDQNSKVKKDAQEIILKHTKEFFSKTLTGLDVNFITTK